MMENLLPKVEIPRELFWEGTLAEYLEKVLRRPRLVRTAHQRMYDMILSYGKKVYTRPWRREPIIHYNLFDDSFGTGHRHAIFGVDEHLMNFVGMVQAGAYGLGQQSRIILVEGPVGTAKSTLGELLAAGLEDFSQTENGAYYATFWVVGEDHDGVVSKDQGAQILGTTDTTNMHRFDYQMHEQPLRIIPKSPVNIRAELLKVMNARIEDTYKGMDSSQMGNFLGIPEREEIFPHFLSVESKACPRCSDIFWRLTDLYKGDWQKVLTNHMRVKRVLMSRDRRVGIAITRPKSEKDQDSSEWSGETNYVALGKFGSPIDPRTFEFRGYFEIAEGGMLYSEEWLKLTQTFLYDYLGASQEGRVQPKGLQEVDIDVVIIGGTNEPEYNKLTEDDKMEALRDRIVRVKMPYIDNYLEEERIYQKFLGSRSEQHGRHIAPFAVRAASFWAVLTRLEKSEKIKPRDKANLYAGKHVEGHTEDDVRELKAASPRECREGASPRYVNDRLSQAFIDTFVSRPGKELTTCVTPFAVLQEMEDGLTVHQHLKKDTAKREKWAEMIQEATAELNAWLTAEIQEIIVGDKEALEELHRKFISNLMAKRKGKKIEDETRGFVDADEDFLQAIEAEAGRTDKGSREAFEAKIVNAIADRATQLGNEGTIEPFRFNSDDVLLKAYKNYLFKQQQKNIDWQALVSKKVVGTEALGKVASIREGLKKKGCCEVCASAFLTHVAGIFIRGTKK